MDALDLVAKIKMDTSEYEQGLQSASSSAGAFGKTASTVAGVGLAAFTTGLTAVAAGVGTVTSQLKSGISSVAEYADHIDKQSQKMNMSAESYQEWNAVMQHCGTTMDSLQSSIKTLSSAAESGNEAFGQLGITQEEIASMSSEELFNSTITALQNVEDETERTYLAGQLLGRGATELGALLNTSAEDTQAMKDRVSELGGVLSDDAVKAGAAFKDSLQDMQTAFTGLKNNMSAEFLPSVTTVMDGLTEIFAGDSTEGLELMSEGIAEFSENLNELIPKITEVGGSILSSLVESFSENSDVILGSMADLVTQIGEAIITNLPELATSATEILMKISDTMLDQAPLIMEVGMTILTNLLNGLSQSLPTLIPKITEVVTQMVTTFLENLPAFIEAGMSVLQAVIEGLIAALPILIEYLPELITTIIDVLVESIPEILDAATEMFLAIVEALPDIITALTDALPEVIDSIVSFLTGDGSTEILTSAIDMFMAIVSALPQILGSLLTALATLLASVVSGLASYGSKMLSAAQNLFTNIITAFTEKASEILNNIKEKLAEWVGAVKEKVSEWKNAGIELINGLWEGFKSKLASVKDSIVNGAKTITDGVKNVFSINSPSKVFAGIGASLVEGLEDGWDDNIDEANNKIDSDLNGYQGSVEMDYKLNTVQTATNKTKTLSESDVSKLLSNLSINLTNNTNVDGKNIKSESYKYTVNRIGNETRALKVATGGAY